MPPPRHPPLPDATGAQAVAMHGETEEALAGLARCAIATLDWAAARAHAEGALRVRRAKAPPLNCDDLTVTRPAHPHTHTRTRTRTPASAPRA